jgi:hypothetical protein
VRNVDRAIKIPKDKIASRQRSDCNRNQGFCPIGDPLGEWIAWPRHGWGWHPLVGLERGGFWNRRSHLSQTQARDFWQLCEIDCHLSRLVDRQEVGFSCSVGVSQSIKHGDLLPGGVVNRESVRDFNNPPRCAKAAGHRSGQSSIFLSRRRDAFRQRFLSEVSQPHVILRHEQVAVFHLA